MMPPAPPALYGKISKAGKDRGGTLASHSLWFDILCPRRIGPHQYCLDKYFLLDARYQCQALFYNFSAITLSSSVNLKISTFAEIMRLSGQLSNQV